MSDAGSGEREALAHLVVIRPGPCYGVEEFEPLCRTLSARFSGEIWVPGSLEADAPMGRFRLHIVREKSPSPIKNFIDFARRVSSRASQLRRSRLGPTVVTAYDPFRSGLLGRWVAARLDAPFVCEINGVYGSLNNLADIDSALRRRLRLGRMRLLGSLVLSGAQGVKLLFTQQLDRFARPARSSVVRSFFDFCNTERFYPGPEEPIILSVGYPFRTKGVDVLCTAFSHVAPRFPAWNLVLIGHRIPDEARLAGFTDPRIVLLPGAPQRKIAEWVSRCSIFALASRSEAMGRVLIEAAAAGKCRLASRVGGIPTVIEDGVDGMLFESENVDELAARLEALMSDADLRGRLATAAHRRAETDFSPDAYLARYCELIESILSLRSRARGGLATL